MCNTRPNFIQQKNEVDCTARNQFSFAVFCCIVLNSVNGNHSKKRRSQMHGYFINILETDGFVIDMLKLYQNLKHFV